eukprot:TRINITY_DN9486_c0_g1_i1.p1 TRINITY_DN9486_c0_g1~~TRINITY_DN9486_c0_g1_i1.p1  ORF type:complete len:303 (-),score=82.03 TRINITY_DN9486_c0_g1_i1:89-997(-)
MASVIAKILKEKRTGAKSDQALRKILNYLDYNKNFKIRLEDFIDIMEEHDVDIEPEEVLELCDLTEDTGEICQSTLMIFVKNSNVWKVLEKQISYESSGQSIFSQGAKGQTKIDAISLKVNKVHAAFNVLDSDRDGFVTKQDFRNKFHNLNSNQIDVVFNKYDRANNGKLSFVEFKNFMSRRPLPIKLESRRHSILSLPDYSSLSTSEPPRYSSLSLYPPRYSSLGTGRKDSLESNESLGDTFLKDDDDMKTPESPEDVSTEMTSMSNDCSRSMEALNISPGEDSAENEEILSTISEEGDES